jgi:hypothetical protein
VPSKSVKCLVGPAQYSFKSVHQFFAQFSLIYNRFSNFLLVSKDLETSLVSFTFGLVVFFPI